MASQPAGAMYGSCDVHEEPASIPDRLIAKELAGLAPSTIPERDETPDRSDAAGHGRRDPSDAFMRLLIELGRARTAKDEVEPDKPESAPTAE